MRQLSTQYRLYLAGGTPVMVACLVFCTTMSTIGAGSEPPVASSIHPQRRVTASPSGGAVVALNPPPLLWPVVSGSDVRYQVQLSPTAGFSDAATIGCDPMRWALFNPHRKLAAGTWYWRYKTTRPSKSTSKWSAVFRFKIADSARSCVTPPAEEMIKAIPIQHPRILVSADKLTRVRQRAKGTDYLASSIRAADRVVNRPVRRIEAARPSSQGKDAFEAKNFAKWASKGFAAKLLGEVKTLTLAYLLTGDGKYGDAAVKRGLAIAQFDPNGATSRKVSDFADGSCMEAMALVYDSCYDQLDARERDVMRQAMLARTAPWFARQINSLEARVFSAHIWQHILLQTTAVGLALQGEVPKADMWLTYVYELWQARVPLLGGSDGGWANGVNYFGTNFKTLLEMPTLFERYVPNADLFGHPWYQNTIMYQIYTWPPGSASDGFGDGSERAGTPPASRAMFLYVLSRRFQDPAALWYARQVAGKRKLESLLTPMLWLDQTVRGDKRIPPKPGLPADLPRARQFHDTGIVSMHTNLASPADDLMIGFRASPYGSYNHMHADQNSFNLLLGGRRLLAGSGYYIGYGDAHFKGWYTRTRSQNSVLIDDRGQVRGTEGYGQVVRFLHGRQISYCAGDASHAYGHAGLTRFRRHLAFLRPATIVIYDDLKADHAARWSWLLHSSDKMSTVTDRARVLIAGATARAQVDLFARDKLRIMVSDIFHPAAVNWRNKTSGGQVIQYPNQWHATAQPLHSATSTRFLAVIQVGPRDESALFSTPTCGSEGVVRVANWRIAAALDPARPASLQIERADGKAALAVDCRKFTVGGVRYQSTRPESVLIDTATDLVQRCPDQP